MARTPEQKAKAAKHARESRKRNPDKWREYDLKKNFGISLEEYGLLFARQQGVCAICGNQETVIDKRTNQPRRLAVDHCHTTKKVRGLLCMGCNQGLGNFRDNPKFLVSAASYLLGP